VNNLRFLQSLPDIQNFFLKEVTGVSNEDLTVQLFENSASNLRLIQIDNMPQITSIDFLGFRER